MKNRHFDNKLESRVWNPTQARMVIFSLAILGMFSCNAQQVNSENKLKLVESALDFVGEYYHSNSELADDSLYTYCGLCGKSRSVLAYLELSDSSTINVDYRVNWSTIYDEILQRGYDGDTQFKLPVCSSVEVAGFHKGYLLIPRNPIIVGHYMEIQIYVANLEPRKRVTVFNLIMNSNYSVAYSDVSEIFLIHDFSLEDFCSH